MTGRRGPRGLATAIKGVVMAGLLASLLSGCAGGEDKATAADEQFLTVEHVVRSHTTTLHSGVPWNTSYSPTVVIDEGLDVKETAQVVNQVILVAQEELASANVGVRFYFSTETKTVNLKEITPMLGEVGLQGSGMGNGTLNLTQADLNAYVAPGDGS